MRVVWFLLAGAAIFAAACGGDDEGAANVGGSGVGSSTGGSGGSPMSLPEPDRHRPAAESCTGEPPPGNPLPDPVGECATDADCTDGINGRCIWPYGGENVCRYDECFEDADCGGAAVCACRVGSSFGFNRCFFGNCLLDADCGSGGWCSPSAVHVGPTCMTGIAPGSVGFFCRTPEDECLDDIDCGGESVGACLFDVDAMHWVCQELLCTG